MSLRKILTEAIEEMRADKRVPHRCPRRDENPSSDTRFPGPDHYQKRSNGWAPGCSYCGSISGEDFMAFVRAGGHVEGTDKNYKTYVTKDTGVPAVRIEETVTIPSGGSYQSTTIKEGTGSQFGKFYYQHLSEEQCREFVDLWNAKQIDHSIYVLPFFMGRG